MPTRNDRPTSPRTPRVLVALGVTAVVIVFIVLHLTGVLGPGSR
jgi:hypothetical protein